MSNFRISVLFTLILSLCLAHANCSANNSCIYENNVDNESHEKLSLDKFLSKLFVASENVMNELFLAHYPENIPLREEYDFIIIGAGPSGCVLANRLSENPNYSVLLLEAGSPENPIITNVPMASPNLQSTNFNWGYATEPQKNACLSMRDKRCNWPHGRGLGGSTIINYTIYTRGNRRDFDRWAAAGNLGWSYKEVLPYFQKVERSTLNDSSTLGTEGLFTIEYPPYRTPLSQAFIESAKMANYSQVNYNDGDQIGVSYLQASTRGGWRQTAAKAYLAPVKERFNLDISPKSWATKLIFDSKNESVQAVKFFRNKQEIVVRAKKEVILSAGAFESPKILMLSGIGPRAHLEELNIPFVKDLPVGQNLHEHMAVFGPIFTVDKLDDGLASIDDVTRLKPILEFLDGKGPLTMNGIETLLYMKANHSADADLEYPDIELLQSAETIGFDKAQGTRLGLGMSVEAYDAVFKPLEDRRAFQILPMLLHPHSKGYLKLKSSNPFHHPLFFPNFFEDSRDLQLLLDGIREAIRVVEQQPFTELGVKLYNATVPGCEHTVFNSDDYWYCFIRHLSATLHHQIGTCKMGPSSDNSTVVDASARVHGFSNLRVADVSIIPQPPSGHTAAYSFMIGEKIADLILSKWKNESTGTNEETISQRTKRKSLTLDWQYQSDSMPMQKTDSATTEQIWQTSTTKMPQVKLMQSIGGINVSVISKHSEQFSNPTLGDVGAILWKSSHDSSSTVKDVDTATTAATVANKSARAEVSTTSERNAVVYSTEVDESTTVNEDVTGEGQTSTHGAHSLNSGMDQIMATMPAVNEDMIRTYTLSPTQRYGHGRAKAKYITKELAKMSFTEMQETESTSVRPSQVKSSSKPPFRSK